MQQNSKRKNITVVGGATIDLTYFIPQFPAPNSVVETTKYILTPGGKALNITTCLKRLHLPTNLITAIGNDFLGDQIQNELEKENISLDGLIRKDDVQTDMISILIDNNADSIVIGTHLANYQLSKSDIDNLKGMILKSTALVVTMEIPQSIAKYILQLAKDNNILTIFNPAPPEILDESIYPLIDYLILNEREAMTLSQQSTLGLEEILNFYKRKGVTNTIITLGSKGTIAYFERVGIISQPAFTIKAIDTTGAGDTYCSVLIKSIFEEKPPLEAIINASAAGAIVASRSGSIPTEEEIENFINKKVQFK